MIKGIPEDDVDDRIKVEEIFEFLKVDKEGIKSVQRVGSKSNNKTPTEEGQGTEHKETILTLILKTIIQEIMIR